MLILLYKKCTILKMILCSGDDTMILMLFCLVVITLDIVTGIIKSIKNKKFDSSKMRKGGLNKICELIVLILGFVLKTALPHFKIVLNFDVLFVISSYIFFMEVVSIIENIGEINDNLIPPKIKNTFKKLKKEGEN